MATSATRRRVPLWLPWLALAVVAVAALAAGSLGTSTPPTAADRVLTLTQSIRCPQCAGQSVAESDVAISREVRRDIAQRVEQGQTDDDILAYYASDTVFGSDALLTPPTDGVGGLVWILPVVAVIGAAVALGLTFRAWSASAGRSASSADKALVDQLMADRSPDSETHDDVPRSGSGHGGA